MSLRFSFSNRACEVVARVGFSRSRPMRLLILSLIFAPAHQPKRASAFRLIESRRSRFCNRHAVEPFADVAMALALLLAELAASSLAEP